VLCVLTFGPKSSHESCESTNGRHKCGKRSEYPRKGGQERLRLRGGRTSAWWLRWRCCLLRLPLPRFNCHRASWLLRRRGDGFNRPPVRRRRSDYHPTSWLLRRWGDGNLSGQFR
jgi:hypothetical protein